MPDPSRTGRVPAPRLERDRVTVGLYAAFATWGWFLYSFSPAVPLIATEQGISRGQAGLHGTFLACGALITGLLTGYLNPRLGRRKVILLAGIVLVTGLALLLSGGTLAVTLPAMLVIGIGGNLAVSAAQPALAVHHHEASSAAVTEANGFGALVGLVAPLALGASVSLGLGWRPAVGLTIVLTGAMLVLVRRLPAEGALGRLQLPVAPAAPAATAPVGAVPGGAGRTGSARTGSARTGFSPAFWLFLVAVLTAVAIENATTYWAADLLRSQSGMSAGPASAALAALIGGMCAARFLIAPLSLRLSPEVILIGSFVLAGLGWLVFWLSTTPVPSVAGLVVAGLGYGAQYPLSIVLVMRASDGRPDAAQARSALAAGAALAVAPFLLGALADVVGPHTAFVLVPVLVAIGAGSVALGRRSELGHAEEGAAAAA